MSQIRACTDKPGFSDQLGFSCEDWQGYDCSRAAEWGYSNTGMNTLLSNCAKSCGHCATQSPSLSPTPALRGSRSTTAEPSPPPAASPSTSPGDCKDADGFVDQFGALCVDWTGFDCDSAELFGYTQQGARAVIQNCRESCGVCTASAPGSPPTTAATLAPTGTVLSQTPAPASDLLNSSQSRSELEVGSPGTSTDPCVDVEGYVDEFGASCTDWAGFDCSNAGIFGYSTQGAESVMVNCRDSCGLCSGTTTTTSPPTGMASSPAPTQPPTRLNSSLSVDAPEPPCVDAEEYFDEFGASCTDWVGFDCSAAAIFGYSPQGAESVLVNCRVSCLLCGTITPTSSPTWLPTQSITFSLDAPVNSQLGFEQAPTRSSTVFSGTCTDVDGYVDQFGASCNDWQGFDCNSAEIFGYTIQGAEGVITNCLESCGFCRTPTPTSPPTIPPTSSPTEVLQAGSCSDVPTFVDEFGSACADWSGYDCGRARVVFQYSENGQKEILANCPSSCGLCPADEVTPTTAPTTSPTQSLRPIPKTRFASEGSCHDAQGFVDEFGSHCADWADYDCNRAEEWGYTLKGKHDLFSGCMQTCGFCKEIQPTPGPTPAETSAPTFGPTMEPTMLALLTAVPTPSPMARPTASPQSTLTPAPTIHASLASTLPLDCVDTPNFVDHHGYPCSAWVGYDCEMARVWGYAPFEKFALEQNCQRSCALCLMP